VSWFFRIVHFSFRLFVPEGQRWAASESRLSVSQSVRCLVRVCVCSVKEFVCLVWLHLRTGKGHFVQQYTDWERQWRTASEERREIRPWRFLPDGGTWNSAAGWTSIGYTLANPLNQMSIWCTPWAAAAVE
jgi:hypothetical protein